MPSLDLVERIAHRLQEVLVGGDDRPIDLKLDDCLRVVDGREDRREATLLGMPGADVFPVDDVTDGFTVRSADGTDLGAEPDLAEAEIRLVRKLRRVAENGLDAASILVEAVDGGAHDL